jgi:hypothetical protein
MIDGKGKIMLDFYKSEKGGKKEYLTMRKFYSKQGKWFPDPKNGVYFPIEAWEIVIPKLREMIYYKTAPAGAPPFESDEEGKTFEDREEAPACDFLMGEDT